MTDKEVIIDGVNVAGCEWLDINEDSARTHYYCDNAPNIDEQYCNGQHIEDCIYKQLQRKEQECEKLKIQLMHKDEVNMFFNTPIEGWSNDPCEICPYKQEYKRLQAENEELKKNLAIADSNHEAAEKENDCYMRALEDVKKNAKNICEYCGNRDTKWCNNDCDVFNELTIINEVLKDG